MLQIDLHLAEVCQISFRKVFTLHVPHWYNQLRFVYTNDDNFKISIDIDNLCTQGDYAHYGNQIFENIS